jgi:hypothetical protein
VDEVMCGVQGNPEKAQAVRLCPLPVRLAVVGGVRRSLEKAGLVVAKIIEFYIPSSFRKNGKWIPPEQRGKVIEFPIETKKTA